jgi:hypothetical protein
VKSVFSLRCARFATHLTMLLCLSMDSYDYSRWLRSGTGVSAAKLQWLWPGFRVQRGSLRGGRAVQVAARTALRMTVVTRPGFGDHGQSRWSFG